MRLVARSLQLVWGVGWLCSISTVIPGRKWGKEPGSPPETWGFGEKLDVVLSCVWGGKGALGVWHRGG